MLLIACGGAERSRAAPLYEATVRGKRDEAAPVDASADASVVTDDRTPRAGESVAALVAEMPGVTVTRLGGIGALSLASLRGSTAAQVGVYLDGVPLNLAQGGGVDLSTIPIGDVERIEVYRGTTPIAFGASQLGGIISVTTRAPRGNDVRVGLGAGSFDTFSADAGGSLVARKLRVYAGAHYLTTAGNFWFTTDNGTAFDGSGVRALRRANNDVKDADGTVRAVYAVDPRRTVSALALVFFRDQGLPGYGSLRQTTATRLASLRLIASAAYDARDELGAGSRLHLQLYGAWSSQTYHDPLGEISIAPSSTRDRSEAIGVNLRLSRPLGSWLLGSAVVEGRDELFSPYDALARPAVGAPATRYFAGAGVEADAAVKRARLHLVPSVRVEAARDTRSGRDVLQQLVASGAPITKVVPAARLALLYAPHPAVTLKANGARYGRLPSTYELYGDSGFVLGNATLRPEAGWNADAGATLRFAARRLSARIDATGFASFVDDLIQYQQDAYGRARATNLGRARVLGAEASLELRGEIVRLVCDGTFTDARDVSPTSVGAHEPLLPNRPRFHFYARPEARYPLDAAFALGVYLDVDVTDGNYLDAANLVALPPRLLVGAGLYAEATRAHLLFTVSAQNLGDTRSFDFAGFPLPSRSFFVTAHLLIPKEN